MPKVSELLLGSQAQNLCDAATTTDISEKQK